MHFANDDDDNDDILNPLYCPPSKILSFLRKQQQHRLFVSLFEVLYIHASSPGRPASIPHTFIHVQESSSQPSPSRFRLFSLTWEAQAEAEGGAKVEEAVKEVEEAVVGEEEMEEEEEEEEGGKEEAGVEEEVGEMEEAKGEEEEGKEEVEVAEKEEEGAEVEEMAEEKAED